MFSSIGWVEIIVVVLLGLVIIGPERLPGVIMDVRAAIYAARKAINNAKAELNGELGGLGSEFDDLRVPLSQAAQWTRLGPRGVITKALFDGDDSAWDDFNPKKMAEDIKSSTAPTEPQGTPADKQGQNPQQSPQARQAQQAQSPQRPTFDYSQVYAEQPAAKQEQPAQPEPVKPETPPRGGTGSTGGGFSWGDVT
ncbi:Sec-independent protein translocase TatB [uncultured Corynebacterium sp.]|uniref:Sec-independent protein translocase TatB n=1 Tax=uncultured Corynebacterium sp. TaxID=159447 RepID=UPI0025E319E9|nr:Sec-independent protein translocase TatB [uncultured Corynebacterium sp.]